MDFIHTKEVFDKGMQSHFGLYERSYIFVKLEQNS